MFRLNLFNGKILHRWDTGRISEETWVIETRNLDYFS